MEKITFQLPEKVNFAELLEVTEGNNLELTKSTKRGSSGNIWYDVFCDLNTLGSLASLLSLFLYIKEKYGKKEVLRIEIPINGGIAEKTIDYLINYLTNLKNSLYDSNNQK